MALLRNRIKGATLIESIVAFTLIVVIFGIGLTLITQLQSQRHKQNSELIYAVKKIHAEQQGNDQKRKKRQDFYYKNWLIEQQIRLSKNKQLQYEYRVLNSEGEEQLFYGFIEAK